MTLSATQQPPSIAEHDGVLPLVDAYQPLILLGAIGAGLAVGRASASVAGALGPVVLGGVFTLILLTMLTVEFGQVADAFAERRFIGLAVVINFVIVPVLAWGLAAGFLSGEPDLQAGLLLFLLTPCIGWYLAFTELAGGDTALGVSLLGINLVLQLVLLPAYLVVFLGQSGSVPLGRIAGSVLLFLVLPTAVAAAIRALARRSGTDLDEAIEFVDRLHLKTVVLFVIVAAMFASQASVLVDHASVLAALALPLLAFFAVTFLLALAAGRVAGLPFEKTVLLVFTTTSRNSEASLAVATTAFASPLVGVAVVIGPIVELPLLILMVRVLRRGRR